MGFAGEQSESRVAVSHAVNVDAFGIHLVESNFNHAAKFGGGIQSRFLLGHVHGIFRAFNAKLVADGDGVGGAFLDALGEGAGILLAVADGNIQRCVRGFAGVVGGGCRRHFGVQICVVRREHGGVGGGCAGCGGRYASFKGVMPFNIAVLGLWNCIAFCHNNQGLVVVVLEVD